MPAGKPAGVACLHLDSEKRCRLFGDPRRPAVCNSLRPQPSMCGSTAEEALRILTTLEIHTRPS
jgi:uncharacterized protein